PFCQYLFSPFFKHFIFGSFYPLGLISDLFPFGSLVFCAAVLFHWDMASESVRHGISTLPDGESAPPVQVPFPRCQRTSRLPPMQTAIPEYLPPDPDWAAQTRIRQPR